MFAANSVRQHSQNQLGPVSKAPIERDKSPIEEHFKLIKDGCEKILAGQVFMGFLKGATEGLERLFAKNSNWTEMTDIHVAILKEAFNTGDGEVKVAIVRCLDAISKNIHWQSVEPYSFLFNFQDLIENIYDVLSATIQGGGDLLKSADATAMLNNIQSCLMNIDLSIQHCNKLLKTSEGLGPDEALKQIKTFREVFKALEKALISSEGETQSSQPVAHLEQSFFFTQQGGKSRQILFEQLSELQNSRKKEDEAKTKTKLKDLYAATQALINIKIGILETDSQELVQKDLTSDQLVEEIHVDIDLLLNLEFPQAS